MHGICLAQNASIALRQAFSIWLKFCKPVNSKAIRTIFWTGCLLREYSKDCSIKLNLLPHLKAQAILISDGKPLALQHLKYLHVPQRTDKPSRHLGVLAPSSQGAFSLQAPLLAKPVPPGTPVRASPQLWGRNRTLSHRSGTSPQEVCLGKIWFLLAILLCHVPSWLLPVLSHAPSQPGFWVGQPPLTLPPLPHNRSLSVSIPLVANGSLSRQRELYEKFKTSP